MSRLAVIPGLDAKHYPRHRLHAEERVWVEKNCYVDVWIELIHALGLEPLAMLPFTVAVDFEGDQWTFFKPPHSELYDLYGIDVQELNVWRPLLDHVIEHLGQGRVISTEADAFWLPDTAGTDYRRQHTKSTIIVAEIDVEQRRLGYFHNAGYFMLQGEDFIQTFRLGFAPDPAFMPLFAEVVRLDRRVGHDPSALARASLLLWRRHLARVPATNPVRRFRERLEAELPRLQEQGLPYYHAWAFATIRQLGAAFELAALNLRWLQPHTTLSLEAPAAAFEAIAATAKTLILKGARAVNARRTLDAREALEPAAVHWDQGIHALSALL
jgi:hypothetical protein